MKAFEIKEEHYTYYNVLEKIRKSGICNMWGATPYLMEICDELTRDEAKEILLEWIENYNELNKIFEWRKML
jgi:hypothetical protein